MASIHINRPYFKLRQKMDGRNEKLLMIECKNCFENNKDFFANDVCIICFFKNLYQNKNRYFCLCLFGT